MTTKDSWVPLPSSGWPKEVTWQQHDWNQAHPEQLLLHGYCAEFCNTDGPKSGASVKSHGAWCESILVSQTRGVMANGRTFQIFAGIARPYVHGVYEKVDLSSRWDHSDEAVALSMCLGGGVDEESTRAFVTPAEARSLAAALTYAADAADGFVKIDR